MAHLPCSPATSPRLLQALLGPCCFCIPGGEEDPQSKASTWATISALPPPGCCNLTLPLSCSRASKKIGVFITHYQRRSNLTSQYPSNDDTSDFEKHHTSSRQGSEMMRKISSAFLKVFSRSNTSVPKPSSPSPPHQDR
ncbi:hypothetical protein Celaphus_00009527, partial [Cervus elaphus hippelaphus]